jgi:tetratricopeptide (TPR) repeat protein
LRAAGPASSSTASPATWIAGRYRVEDALGKGGAAQVLRVTDMTSGKQLALKRLNNGASRRLTSLFELEYRTLASLSHPGTVQVFEYGRDGDAAFYTMELLLGEDLKGRAPLPWREACSYLRDAAQALALLHARKLVHRDVSPRNLWRLPSGRVKLIDFGALLPFGPSDHVMGTPPLIPPEALRQQPLDQRADLYALGAVGYYLLTGVHAFPARNFDELPALWTKLPLPASELVQRLRRSDLEAVPGELDALLAALLSPEPLARPGNTQELIDRLDTLLGNARPSQAEGAELHLSNSAFAGRTRELRRLKKQLLLAARGRGQSALVEGAAGLGRTRLLKELSLEARVLPALVLQVHADAHPGLYGVASALGMRVLDELPREAREAALPHAAVLAHASPRLRERLAVAPLVGIEGSELRVRIQAAFRDWFLALSQQHTLALFIDDFEHVDDGTGAFLLSLSLARKTGRLFLLCARVHERKRVPSALERALARASHNYRLGPLAEAETFELLHSVFGGAEHLARLTSRLQRSTRGNPGHMLELCGQLVRSNVIGFSHGSWLLPQEISPEHLNLTREQAITLRLALLSEGARKLARVLSLHVGSLPTALCQALAATVSEHAMLSLGLLLDEEIVVRDEQGVRFVHEELRELLSRELSAEERVAARRVIGEFLLSQPEPTYSESLRAGYNLLDSGDRRGIDLVVQASLKLAIDTGSAQLGASVGCIEDSLRIMRAQKRPAVEQVALLAALSMAGYYVDRGYALRYGGQTVAMLADLTRLSLARRLSGFLGNKVGLVLALVVAAVALRLRPKSAEAPGFGQLLQLLFSCIGALAGSSAVCIDPDGAQRYADVLTPFAALGQRTLAGFMYTYCSALAESGRDRWGATLQRWQTLIDLLERNEVKGVSSSLRKRLLAGALSTSGVLQAQRDGPHALETAARLEQQGHTLDRMGADQVRMAFYAHQGNVRQYAVYAARAEQHAIQQGTSWQMETWFASVKASVALRTHDVMGLKHASEHLQKLSQTIPSLDLPARRTRGTYLMTRKKYAEALPWLEEVLREESQSTAGWSTIHGVLARVYNRLGEYERARSTCLRALSVLTPADFAIPGLYLIVQTEVLVAEAGLRRAADARRGLAALIEQHAPNQGPLTMGQLHEAGVDIALLGRDEEGARRHYEETRRWYLGTGEASLAQRVQWLGVRVAAKTQHGTGSFEAVRETHTTMDTFSAEGSVSHTVDRMLAGGRMSMGERAQKALQILAEHSRCTVGFLYLLNERAQPVLSASLKDEPPALAVSQWVERRIAHELEDEMTLLDEDEDVAAGSTHELQVLHHEGRAYRVLLLVASSGSAHGVVGAAVVAPSEGMPAACSGEVMSAVAYHLQQARQRAQLGANSLVE